MYTSRSEDSEHSAALLPMPIVIHADGMSRHEVNTDNKLEVTIFDPAGLTWKQVK